MIDLKTLSLYVFIRLNEIKDVRKVSLMDVLLFDQILTQEALRFGLRYKTKIITNYYTDINFNSNNVLHCNEENEGYVIKLAKDADINLLKEQLKEVYDYLNILSRDIDINYLFFPETRKLKNKNLK